MADFVIPSVFKAVDKFSGTVEKIEKSVRKFSDRSINNLARVERRFRRIGTAAASVGRNAALMGAAILSPMVLMANESVKFEKSMGNIATIIDTNSESIESMGDRVLELAEKLPVPIEELTASLYDIRSAGISASEQFQVLETAAKLSVAGLSSTSEATDILTSSINAFASEGLTANEIANILFKSVQYGKTTISQMSQQFGAVAPMIESSGIKLSEYAATTSALTLSGIEASKVQTMLKAAISNLQKPTKDMEAMFKKLGVTTHNELIEKFGGLVPSFQAIQDEAERSGTSMAKLFGSVEGLNAVTGLLGANNQAYLDTLEQMTNGTNVLDQAFEKQTKTSAAQLQMAKNQIKGLSIQIGNVMLPIINDLLKSIMPTIKSFGRWAKENKGLLATIVKITAAIGGLSFVFSGVAFAVAGFSKIMVGAMQFLTVAIKGSAMAMKILNSVWAASPIGLIIAGVVALGGAIYMLTRKKEKLTTAEKLANEVGQRALENTIDQRVEISLLFNKLRNLESGTAEYMSTLAKVEAIQPGITQQFNLQEGAIRNLAQAEAELTKNILKRAQTQAKSEILAEKTKELLELQMEGAQQSGRFGLDQKIYDQIFVAQQLDLQDQINQLTQSITADQLGDPSSDPLNPDRVKEERTFEQKQQLIQNTIKLEMVNMPDWIRVQSGLPIANKGGGIMPKTTSTIE